MKTGYFALAISLLMASLCMTSSCTNDDSNVEVKESEKFTFSCSLPSEPQTRLAYTDEKEAGKGGSLQWKGYEVLAFFCYKENGDYVGFARSEFLSNEQIENNVASFTFSEEELQILQNEEITHVDAYVSHNGEGDFTTDYDVFGRKIVFAGFEQDNTFQRQWDDDNSSHVSCLALTKPNIAKADLFNGTPIALEMGGSIMRFDLTNLPEDLGKLKKLTWQVDGNDGPSHRYNLNLVDLTISSEKKSCTLYLGFLPDDMTIKAGGGFHLTLEGDKTYTASKELPTGMTYEAGKRYVAAIDNTESTMKWEEPVAPPIFVATTTIGSTAGYTYNGLKMELGYWNGYEDATIATTTIVDGKACFADQNVVGLNGQKIWLRIPGVVKFFHVLTEEEANANALTLPDKDLGSTLLSGNYQNDWQVALYMGINKDNSSASDATPLYWATGNLIAAKSSDSNYAFFIGSAEETEKETNASTDYFAPASVTVSNSNGYAGCTVGALWDKFGWGDPTGLVTSENEVDYTKSLEVGEYGGNASVDIARKQLGGTWRLASANEFAFNGTTPSAPDYRPSQDACTCISYTYSINDAGSTGNTITNTLYFPGTGQRTGSSFFNGGSAGKYIYYWTGTLYDAFGYKRPYLWYYIGYYTPMTSYEYAYFGYAIRPVTE